MIDFYLGSKKSCKTMPQFGKSCIDFISKFYDFFADRKLICFEFVTYEKCRAIYEAYAVQVSISIC